MFSGMVTITDFILILLKNNKSEVSTDKMLDLEVLYFVYHLNIQIFRALYDLILRPCR